jgi:hypothetical protein
VTDLHVTLAREAAAVGLTVTRLMPVDCDHPYEPCFTIQLWLDNGTLWAEGRHESTENVRAHIARRREEILAAYVPPPRRLRECVEAWPEAETGEYNPHCCRWPKSCSATVYRDEQVTEDDLEPAGGAA